MKKILIALFLIFTGFNACRTESKPPRLTDTDVTRVIEQMTDVMTHDVTNPPLAARFFAYSCLAGYEVIAQNNTAFKSMYGKLNNYPHLTKPSVATGYDYHLSALLAMLKTAQKLQPSGEILVKYEQRLLDSCKKSGFSAAVVDSSASYAKQVSKQILAYAKADKYNRISNYKRYQESGGEGSWKTTPPAYISPVEPYFQTIRPLTLDSASQFLPPPPVPFSTNKNSAFYKCLQQNYQKSGKSLTANEQNIASFWDCNPFAVQNDGHMLVGLKKISPGAHWMGITGLACHKQKINLPKTIEIYTVVAVGLMDGFICCWDAKYRTNRIRPETAIRQYIDPNWKPLLQTPPFPEYVSGHSVVSASSAAILTHYFGDGFHYTDDVERNYGIGSRSFTSFKQAADEAAISRFWGGIHFMDAIKNGLLQGDKVGNWVLAHINPKAVNKKDTK